MIRQLGPEDLEAYRALWLDALAHAPDAFLLTADEARAVPKTSLEQALKAGRFWGAFDDGLKGFAVWRRGTMVQVSHSAEFGPFYIAPALRGRGVGRELITAVLQAAREAGVLQMELVVEETNAAAIALYERAGFRQIGRRPRAVLVNGAPKADLLMLCPLDGAALWA